MNKQKDKTKTLPLRSFHSSGVERRDRNDRTKYILVDDKTYRKNRIKGTENAGGDCYFIRSGQRRTLMRKYLSKESLNV